MSEWQAVWQVIAFLVIGGTLLVVECVTPGFTIPGTLGLVLLGVACYLAFRFLHLAAGLATVAVSTALIIGLVRYFPRTRLGRGLSLRLTQQKEAGYHTGGVGVRTGDTGEALTSLRPSGAARIGGRRVDVVTEGGFIEEGASLVVIRVEGTRVVVRQRNGGA